MARTTLLVHALLTSLLVAPAAGPGIHWRAYFEEALRDAEARGVVVFVAVNMDDESSNDDMVRTVYRDKRLVELSEHTINLIASADEHSSGDCKRFGSLTCENHKRVEAAVRDQVVKDNGDGRWVAPQHVFLGPDGEVLLSVPYAVTADELAWCFAAAIRLVDPGTSVTMPAGARPPRRLIMKGVCNSGAFVDFVCPLTDDELDRAISQLRSGWGALESMGSFSRILATDHRDAIKFATTELGSGLTAYSPELTSSLIRTAGRFSPPPFWKALEPCLKHHGRDVRCEAAAALEQLGAEKSLALIRKALSGEDDVDVKKNLVRALGSAGADSAAISKTLIKYAESDDERLVRLNAVLALGYHARRENVGAFLGGCLASEESDVRQAAALAMAFSRDGSYRQALQGAEARETDAQVKALYGRALAVLDGDNLTTLAKDYERIGRDMVRRERFFGR